MKTNCFVRSSWLLPVIIIIFLGLVSCEPDDLSKPVRVHFELSFIQENEPLSFLTFKRVMVGVERINFYGVRQEGNDVVFSTRPGKSYGIHVLTPEQNTSYLTFFDLKQGVYQQMRWELQLEEIDDDVFSEDYLDGDDFGFIIEGIYSCLDGRTLLLFIAIEEEEIIKIESVNQVGEIPIPILADNTYSISLEIYPHAIFKGIPRSLLEQAEVDEDDDVEFIEISKEENEDLYKLFLFQLSKTIRAVVR